MDVFTTLGFFVDHNKLNETPPDATTEDADAEALRVANAATEAEEACAEVDGNR